MTDKLRIAQQFLEGIGNGRPPDEIANLFDEQLSFEIQGDQGALPWIGRRTGRKAFEEFISELRSLTESVAFEVEDILESADRASIVGALKTRIKSTGKVITTQFAIILTIKVGLITRFQMLEDSFAVSNAARA